MHIKLRSAIIGFFQFLLALVIAVIATAPVEINYRPAFGGCGFVLPSISWCYPGFQIVIGFVFGFVLFLLSPKTKLAYIGCVFFIFLYGSLESLHSTNQLNVLGPVTLSGISGALFVFVSFTIFKKLYGENNA